MKNVALLFGGKSVEHAVSINSAKNVFKYIDRNHFNPLLIYISRTGNWFLLNHFDELKSTEKKAVCIELGGEIHLTANQIKLDIDLFFPLVHGTNGEDGSLQGLLNSLGFPYVGCGILGSAVNMSKLTTKKILKQSGLPVNKFLHFQRTDRTNIVFEKVVEELGLPFMVKAANLGSSVGISKVDSKEDFESAIESAFRFDYQVLIEEYVSGREIECAVMGNNHPEASNPGEIVISSSYEFYDFKAKYVDGKAVEIKVPADLEKPVREEIRELCVKAYQALECEDFARVDLFLTNHGIFLNEINTIPGFTNSSMFPMMWQEKGISFTELITQLIELALDRYELLKINDTNYFSELDQ